MARRELASCVLGITSLMLHTGLVEGIAVTSTKCILCICTAAS